MKFTLTSDAYHCQLPITVTETRHMNLSFFVQKRSLSRVSSFKGLDSSIFKNSAGQLELPNHGLQTTRTRLIRTGFYV